MNITRNWRKGMAVGCSHGAHLDPIAASAVLNFGEDWKPHTVMHLGDYIDTTAFMGKGTHDTTEEPRDDFTAGQEFLERYFTQPGVQTKVLTNGNHEDRLWKLASSGRQVVAYAAQQGVKEVQALVTKCGGTLIEYDNMQHYRLGNFKFFHGFMFNENADRDHAEAFGNCVMANWHRVGYAKGRREDNPTCLCVGTLTCIPNMDYAKTQRTRLAWSQGLCYFEYCDDETHVWLVEGPHADEYGARTGSWRFPR